jgi:putative membrane-bound dehydrogenase-like protein
MKTAFRLTSIGLLIFSFSISAEPLKLNARRQVESEKGKGDWSQEQKVLQWEGKKTALIICDMWNEHWCKGATERVGEMAPRMNEVVKAARAKGVFIIHAPSDTMKFYEGTVQRNRAIEARKAVPPVELKRWCNLDPTKEAALPIDDSDGGCDDEPRCKEGPPWPWKRQIEVIEVAEGDAVTDSAEAYNLLEERGIENVIVMGVHANMCVLGRPFSIRQMVGVGKNVVLMRDMTDTMYNSRRRPFVNHFRGTDLIVDHIERYWCPSITSVDFLGGEEFRFSKDPENPKKKSTLNYSEPVNDGEQKGPLSPADSLKAFKVFEDLEIEEVLAEPLVRQPLHLSWDSRGRLWVVQYIQYPAPAGLTLVSKDQFWRAVYDKVPPPPPKHFKGDDKITIHEDTDGDGVLDKHKTFVEGLNIVTAVEHGAGGVWVLNPPYLLFFPDKDGDDVVDADPVVHLAGFGLEDTHSVANSLRWGPDGWLYGAHGSTVTAAIVRPGLDEKPIAHMMGQGIWRYQPESRRFEVFAEGGGNAFGLEIDDQGRIFSGHNGGNTRGFHYVQGGYLQKGFEKHGPLSNPYAFGYFKQMAHPDVERFTHTFVIYGGGALPERYDGQLLGIEPLQGRVVLSEVMRDRSSFKTRDVGYAVTTSDKYFKPVDIKVGPDGAVYIADWYDRQVTHTRNYEGNIDKSNGRVWRVTHKGAKLATRRESNRNVSHLQLGSENRWERQNAWRELMRKRNEDGKILAALLKKQITESSGQRALESLWALNLCEPISDSNAAEFLRHQEPQVRLWTVRLLGDRNEISQGTAEMFRELAEKEAEVEVRSQLASTAKRLPAGQGLPIVRNLLTHHEDVKDIHVPLLLWWAIESKAESDRALVVEFFKDAKVWEMPMVREVIGERIVKRYAMAGTQTDLKTCAELLNAAPEREKKKLVAALEEGFRGRSLARIPKELEGAMAKAGGESLAFAVRRGEAGVLEKVSGFVQDPATPLNKRVEVIEVLGEVKTPGAGYYLTTLLSGEHPAEVREAAVVALQIYDDTPQVAERLLNHAKKATSPVRTYNVLASRTEWAEKLLGAVERAEISARAVPLEIVEKMRANETLVAKVEEVFGPKRELDKAAVDEKLAKFNGMVKSGSGDPFAGYEVYTMACGSCHKLFGEGGQIGPDLTSYRRDDLETMLMSVVNPSGEIREGFENVIIETKDGRNLSGFLAERYEDAVVLRGLDGESTVVKKEEMLKTRAAGASLMPEGLLDGMEEQQIRDLFAYLRSTQPLVKKR